MCCPLRQPSPALQVRLAHDARQALLGQLLGRRGRSAAQRGRGVREGRHRADDDHHDARPPWARGLPHRLQPRQHARPLGGVPCRSVPARSSSSLSR